MSSATARPRARGRLHALALLAASLITATIFVNGTTRVAVAHASTLSLSASGWKVYAPKGHARHPALVFIHGGGWSRRLSTPAEQAFARELARRTGWVVALPSYPVTQPRRFTEPAAVHAAVLAVARMRDVDPARIALWGESAGGHLALLEAYRHPHEGTVRIRAVVSVSGPTDLPTEYASGGQLFLDAIQTFEQASPLSLEAQRDQRYAVTSPVDVAGRGSPPTFQAVSAGDPFVPPSQTTELDRALTGAHVAHQTVVVPGTAHATALEPCPAPPDNRTVADLALAFVRAHLGG